MGNERMLSIIIKSIGVLSLAISLLLGLEQYKIASEIPAISNANSFSIFTIWLGSGLVTCVLFWAFGDIIQYLKESMEMKREQRKELENIKHKLNQINH